MLKNNGKIVIGKNILLCIAVICLMFTAVGFSAENSFAAELNDTVDEIGIESDDIAKLENSQENEILEANSDDNDVLSAERTVTGNTFKDIQNAIDKANPGDSIKLNGEYYSAGSQININKKLIITGTTSTILDGQNLSRILLIGENAGGTEIKNIKFINGKAGRGTAIYIYPKNVFIDNCVFENNYGYESGGAVTTEYDLYSAENLKVTNCKFIGNFAYRENFESFTCGAALRTYSRGTVISNCYFESNWVKGKDPCYGELFK